MHHARTPRPKHNKKMQTVSHVTASWVWGRCKQCHKKQTQGYERYANGASYHVSFRLGASSTDVSHNSTWRLVHMPAPANIVILWGLAWTVDGFAHAKPRGQVDEMQAVATFNGARSI